MDHSTVKCGCGFAASGPDQEKLAEVMDSHSCYPDAPMPWYGWVFSFWGWAIIGTIGVVATILARPELWK